MTFTKSIILFFCMLCTYSICAQISKTLHVADVSLQIDSNTYSLQNSKTFYRGDEYFFFKTTTNNVIAKLELLISGHQTSGISIYPSNDYQILDTLRFENGKWKAVIRLTDLIYSDSKTLILKSTDTENHFELTKIKILPVFSTNIKSPDNTIELLQEEEKTIELPSTATFNIMADNTWNYSDDYDYKIFNNFDKLSITIRPHSLGTKQFIVNLKTLKPTFNILNQLSFDLPPLKFTITVKPNRLFYLNTDKQVIYFDENFKSTEEVQIDYNKSMVLKKTYRIEDQQEDGGILIAEIYPISFVENSGKVICRVKPYAIHKISEGYLYIKEGVRSKFITNFNILEKPEVSRVSVMHQAQAWTNNLTVYPGEEVWVKMEGKGLSDSKITFDGCPEAQIDTLKSSDELAFFSLKIPLGLNKRSIDLFINKKPVPYTLNVSEYQNPVAFDFISVSSGTEKLPLTNDKFNTPIFVSKGIQDIVISFDPDQIDNGGKLAGKQYISIFVKIMNHKNDLIETQEINNIVICPGSNSPRAKFYNTNDCSSGSINLNDYLLHKTYSISPFYQIEITIRHNASMYSSKGYNKKIRFIPVRRNQFDIQVGFPAGLLVKKVDESGYGNLTGISTSILAQLNFYDPKVIGKLKPYSVGGGFIALNAFNFSDNPNNLRDVGIVILGSLTPIRKDAKFSLPIYLGGGYLLKAGTWFFMFGPGIQINF